MYFESITSRQNPKILEAAALKDKKTRKEKGLFFFEGKKLFEEAVKRNVPLVSVFALQKALPSPEMLSLLPEDCRVFLVNDGVYQKITEEKSPEGLFCIAKTIDKYHKFATIYNKPSDFAKEDATLLMAVSLRDPGNLGTVIRSATAFGCAGLIFSEDCADLYSSKTVRASMGTLFDCPVTVVKDVKGTVELLKKEGIEVYAAALDRKAIGLHRLKTKNACCFLVGNEGHGLPQELIDCCSGTVFIPMTERAESLNASIAASVLLYSRFAQKCE
ncbi:MAG: RNA methyltransferase [Clostridia bacterium]|nr:RNA methyltransferase [Clostridia bacterium]